MARHRRKTMKGGLFGSNTTDTNTSNGSLFDSISQHINNAVESTRRAVGLGNKSLNTSNTYGGKTKRRRHMKGGFSGYTPTTGLAEHAASFSGPTAQPQVWLGGKSRKCKRGGKHRHTKSCKHRKH